MNDATERLITAAEAVLFLEERLVTVPNGLQIKLNDLRSALSDCKAALPKKIAPIEVLGWGGGYALKPEQRAESAAQKERREGKGRRRGPQVVYVEESERRYHQRRKATPEVDWKAESMDLAERLGWLVDRHARSCQLELSLKPWDQRRCDCGCAMAKETLTRFNALLKESGLPE